MYTLTKLYTQHLYESIYTQTAKQLDAKQKGFKSDDIWKTEDKLHDKAKEILKGNDNQHFRMYSTTRYM